MRTVPATVLTLVLVLAAPLPASAFPPPEAPLVDQVAFTEAAFSAAYRVAMPAGSFLSVWMLADHEDLAFGSFALWFVDPETFAFNALVNPTWYPEGGHELHLQGETTGLVVSELSGNYPWPLEMRVDHTPSSDREWLVVVIGAFEGDVDGELRLYADGGARIEAVTRGGGFLHTERDFEGTLNVVAREELPVRDAVFEAKLQWDVAVRERALGRMFASFWAGDHLGLQETSVSPPAPIGGNGWHLIHGGPAGEHEFRIDRNLDWHDNQPTCRFLTADRCWRAPAFVLGADITIPQGG